MAKLKDAERISLLHVLAQPTPLLQARAAVKGGFVPRSEYEFSVLKRFRDAPVAEVGQFGRHAYDNAMEHLRQEALKAKKPAFNLAVFDVTDEMMMPEGWDRDACEKLLQAPPKGAAELEAETVAHTDDAPVLALCGPPPLHAEAEMLEPDDGPITAEILESFSPEDHGHA